MLTLTPAHRPRFTSLLTKRAFEGLNPIPRQGRLHALDALRLLAALAVVLYHFLAFSRGSQYGAWQTPPQQVFPTVNPAASYGWLGVELFFLISGFVICMSTWGKPAGRFLVSRFTRLYPAYWFGVLATSAVLAIWPVVRFSPERDDILANLTMFQVLFEVDDIDGVYWSLWAEIRFYLLFFFVAAIGLTYTRVVIFCLSWASAVVIVPALDSPQLYTWTMPTYAPFFIGGIGLYLIYRCGLTLVSGGIVALSWLLAQNQLPGLVHNAQISVRHQLSMDTALIIVTASYALMLALALGAFDRIRWRWLATAGAITYPLYLLHQNIGWTFIRLAHEHVAAWWLLTGLVGGLVLASWLVHAGVERPIARLLNRALRSREPVARKPRSIEFPRRTFRRQHAWRSLAKKRAPGAGRAAGHRRAMALIGRGHAVIARPLSVPVPAQAWRRPTPVAALTDHGL